MKAFPIPEHTKRDYEFPPKHEGMDLRDYFAAKALQGILALGDLDSSSEITLECYRLADKMMEVRNVK